MESGRSFVAPEYWGSCGIDYLYSGIGVYPRVHPEGALPVRCGFDQCRAAAAGARVIVAYHARWHGGPIRRRGAGLSLTKPPNPTMRRSTPTPGGC